VVTAQQGEPLWFGPRERPLFGWVHTPASDQVRSAVVICPSMGQEYAFAHYTLRSVAERLADQGHLVVRFDYDGTGDSLGVGTDPDRVAAWQASIGEALDLARSLTDAPLVLLGLRLGALLAASVAQQRDDVEGLVLWDTPRSGSSYAREQRVRQDVSVGGADPEFGALTAVGLSFSEQTLADLGAINLKSFPTLATDRVLAVVRPGMNPLARDARTRTGREPERLEAPDQDMFMYLQILPEQTEDRVVGWVDSSWQQPYTLKSLDRDATWRTVALDGASEEVSTVEPYGLFAIRTVPDHPTTSTTVVFVPDAFTPHIGLSRIWVELAREWAARGVPTMRFDVSGCGDSPARAGVEGHQVRLVEHIDDVLAATRHARPDDPHDVALVGLCSGAYHALEAAVAEPLRAIAMINPTMAFVPHEHPPSPRRGAMQLTRAALVRTFGAVAGKVAYVLSPRYRSDPTFEWARMLEASYWQRTVNHGLGWLPEWGWSLVNRVLLTRRPDQVLRRVTSRGTAVLYLAGGNDWRISTLGFKRAFRAISRRHDLEVVHLDGLDHALMRPGMKTEVQRRVGDFVLARLAPLDGAAAPAQRSQR
jgi:alpha-beta hydrolase superfamily lysophospholipase